MMGKSNTIAVKVSRKMHDVLEDGAQRTGMSISEFTDLVLRSKVEDELPLALSNAELQQTQVTKDARTAQVIQDSKTASAKLKVTLEQARVIFNDRLPVAMRETLGLMRQIAARRRK